MAYVRSCEILRRGKRLRALREGCLTRPAQKCSRTATLTELRRPRMSRKASVVWKQIQRASESETAILL